MSPELKPWGCENMPNAEARLVPCVKMAYSYVHRCVLHAYSPTMAAICTGVNRAQTPCSEVRKTLPILNICGKSRAAATMTKRQSHLPQLSHDSVSVTTYTQGGRNSRMGICNQLVLRRLLRFGYQCANAGTHSEDTFVRSNETPVNKDPAEVTYS